MGEMTILYRMGKAFHMATRKRYYFCDNTCPSTRTYPHSRHTPQPEFYSYPYWQKNPTALETQETIRKCGPERELFAFLLDAGDQGATKEQISNAIWQESDSKNIKNLIAVNLRHLKNDLELPALRKQSSAAKTAILSAGMKFRLIPTFLKGHMKNLSSTIPRNRQRSSYSCIKENTWQISKHFGLLQKELSIRKSMKKRKSTTWHNAI